MTEEKPKLKIPRASSETKELPQVTQQPLPKALPKIKQIPQQGPPIEVPRQPVAMPDVSPEDDLSDIPDELPPLDTPDVEVCKHIISADTLVKTNFAVSLCGRCRKAILTQTGWEELDEPFQE